MSNKKDQHRRSVETLGLSGHGDVPSIARSKHHLLNKTKQDFVNFLNLQGNDVWWLAMTTPFDANTEFGHFRRSFIRTVNNINRKTLQS